MGVSAAAVALAWVQSRPGITSTLVGARTVEQLELNLTALELQISDEHLRDLEEVSRPTLNFPADNNALYSRLARNGGTTVDGIPTALPPQLEAR